MTLRQRQSAFIKDYFQRQHEQDARIQQALDSSSGAR